MHGPRNAEKIVKTTSIGTMSGRGAATLLGLALAWAPAVARADATKPPEEPSEADLNPSLSIDPSTPQIGALPGGVSPAYGQRSLSEGEWRFDYHGIITAPLSIGINSRMNPGPGQSGTTLHSPPVV